MVKEPNETVGDRIESSECNHPVSRPLTVCRDFVPCSYSTIYVPPFIRLLYSYQFICVVPLLKRPSTSIIDSSLVLNVLRLPHRVYFISMYYIDCGVR